VVAANREGAEHKRNHCCNKRRDAVVFADASLSDVRDGEKHYKSEKSNTKEYLSGFPGEQLPQPAQQPDETKGSYACDTATLGRCAFLPASFDADEQSQGQGETQTKQSI